MDFEPTIKPLLKLTAAEFEFFYKAGVECRAFEVVFSDERPGNLTADYLLRLAGLPGVDFNVLYKVPRPVDLDELTFHDFNDYRPLAFFWTAIPFHKTAFINFGFLPAGLPWRLELGHYVLKLLWWMGYMSLASLTPNYNLPAQKYALDLGGRILGNWPGACYHAGREAYVDGVFIQFLPDQNEEN